MKNLIILIFIALVPTFASAQLFGATNEEAIFTVSEAQSKWYELECNLLHDRLQSMSHRTPDGWRLMRGYPGGYCSIGKTVGDKTYTVEVIKGGLEEWQRNTKTQLRINVTTEDPRGDIFKQSSKTMYFEYDHKTKKGSISMLNCKTFFDATWETDLEVAVRELEAHLMNAEKFL